MEYTENITGIKINVQAVDINLHNDVQETILKSVSRLSLSYDRIEWADIYLENKKEKSTQQKQVSIRLGIPGNDPFASEYGDDFHILIANVEDKLRKQLEKR
ncbi:HPF/RaiA family ribosome-associated protein [Xanthomarina sp. F1114]|uniref:HPF/RaiA family ribosome-associated protein n=1 Tax=Xanthomarina sp. F1114 TaxID=2996019 RepID=UPI00225DF9A8|nr:HPF/RaiA family ribosome-associated protein [Xanthomarina sp. F1114]MCX7548955.1 HPF/RaiA family ribosome-associated protein [Xanthomarina sp. F1114]